MALGRVLIVEDDHLVRTLLKTYLEQANFEVVANCATATEAIEALGIHSVDVALLDLNLGVGPTGIDLAMHLRKLKSSLGLVILTSYSDFRLSNASGLSLPRGVRYLVKSKIANQKQIAQAVLEAKVNPLDPAALNQHRALPLTSKQVEVLKLVIAGVKNQAIATRLGISEKSVENYISRIRKNIGSADAINENPRVSLTKDFLKNSGGQL
jgi:DNA-binding NarL/FixJ family response regulator